MMTLYSDIKCPNAAFAAVVTLILLGCSCIDLGWAQTIDVQPPHTKNIQLFNDKEVNVCPSVGPLLFGDLRYHIGCHLMEQMGDISGTFFEASNFFAQDKMKPASVDRIMEKDANHLLATTDRVNSNGLLELNSSTVTSDDRAAIVNCCNVTNEIVYPLFGFSLSSNTMVHIVQEQLQQAVIYRRCQSKKTSIVHGRCRQGSLPRLTYVYHSKDSGRSGGNPYFQDLVLMPSNCECLISLPPFDSIRDNDDGTIVSESLNEEENSPILTSSMQGSQPIIAGSLPIN